MSTTSGEPLYKIENLTKRFGGLVAVSELTMEIRAGEILGLIGPNGAGKSTTFNLISGFYRPTTGVLTFDGRVVTGMAPEKIAKLGMARTFQHGSLMRELTVRDNIRVGATGALDNHADRMKRVEETAEILGLTRYLDEMAGILPHGIQRLVSIGIAFATRPRLLCLDEPLTGLNQSEVISTLATFSEIRGAFKTTILLVEHNMKAVMKICERIVVLHHGRKLSQGTPAEIRSDASVVSAYLGTHNAS
ncbi:MAG: ABC transporter ATP-binding protein [Hyphomicrobiales bacterium]|nr:MAG: ABC transporter ATP-binding protein [Hyphomicrobiales bacterium]